MIISMTGYSYKRHVRRFSLVELLVVILIIGSLMALGVGGYSIAQKKLAETRTRATLEKIKLALEAYKTKHGYYIQEYGAISGDYYFRLDRAVSGQDNLSKIISYKDTPLYDPADTVAKKSDPDYNAFVLDSYPGKENDGSRIIRYQCPATDAPFELRSSGHDRTFNTDDDVVVN
jgi:type II secretory pathway pseudopilin PulG